MKFIFLDIKNVLNLPHTHKRLEKITNKKELFFNDIYSTATMIHLREICIFAYAFLVLIDDKIADPLTIKKFKANLTIYDIEQYYKGIISTNIKLSKALRINHFIKENKPFNYLILTSDKRSSFNENSSEDMKNRLIRIDRDKGITKSLKDEIISKLFVSINK